jgi:putative FmdB family regulatory protein
MPTYEYSCQKCGKNFDLFQPMKDAPIKYCRCGKKGRVKRLGGTGAGIIFKGSGFYETDYRRPTSKTEPPSEKKPAPAPPSSTPSTPTPPAKT